MTRWLGYRNLRLKGVDPLVAPLVDMNEWEKRETLAFDYGPCRLVGIEGNFVAQALQRVSHAHLRVQMSNKRPASDEKTRHQMLAPGLREVWADMTA
ncbi:MAG TPA: hypothetical protein VKE72_10590 [Methylocella sp.]|nr:hypothetical protein [Methylocella sp.]